MKATRLLLAGFAVSVIVLTGAAISRQRERAPFVQESATPPSTQNRKILDLSSKELPVAVTAINNVDAEDWAKDMEFEVENRSAKPIYYISIVILFPDVPKTNELGEPRGLAAVAQYGRRDFASNPGELAGPDDIPIKPDGKAILKLAAPAVEGIKRHLNRYNLPESATKRLRIRIETVSFGDGSGFKAGDIQYTRRVSLK